MWVNKFKLIDILPFNYKRKFNFLKYLSPLIGILFCPVTILLLWSIWTGPVVESDTEFIEEIQL